ncbi:hypothetical protein [Halomonas sp. MCCC 1A11062]|uniref:hypothetical protein n=1 Tax=Halomonas sp. MCCC 1A11062 TaxID=2733485 RepID=UPI001F3F7F29|nr:hypothetical protein [Halomonas sp. MCCC 1A11062]MCE8040464.1 hypothetical protein [Halomonas sp. MCCC 1A11062]
MKNLLFQIVKVSFGMMGKRKRVVGIFLCVILTILVVRDFGVVKSDPSRFLAVILLGGFASYQIVAFLFGWKMPMLTFTGGLVKGRHDVLRVVMFMFFSCFWLFVFQNP